MKGLSLSLVVLVLVIASRMQAQIASGNVADVPDPQFIVEQSQNPVGNVFDGCVIQQNSTLFLVPKIGEQIRLVGDGRLREFAGRYVRVIGKELPGAGKPSQVRGESVLRIDVLSESCLEL